MLSYSQAPPVTGAVIQQAAECRLPWELLGPEMSSLEAVRCWCCHRLCLEEGSKSSFLYDVVPITNPNKDARPCPDRSAFNGKSQKGGSHQCRRWQVLFCSIRQAAQGSHGLPWPLVSTWAGQSWRETMAIVIPAISLLTHHPPHAEHLSLPFSLVRNSPLFFFPP